MAKRAKYEYACVDKETSCCTAAVYAPIPRYDDDVFEFIRVFNDPENYLDKYYIENVWYTREYTYDENGNVIDYTDVVFETNF